MTASRARYLNAYWSRLEIGSKRLRRRRDEIITMYDSAVCWVDAQLSRLVEVLRRFKLWENCVFALTADHGEEFLEHDGHYHAPALGEELIHVPLILHVPGAARREVCGNPFSLVHLAPTLLGAAGVPIPAEFQGQSHWQRIREGSAWSEAATSECTAGCTNPFDLEQRRGARLLTIREARYKLLLNFDTRTEYLFDLEADPREQTPLGDAVGRPERRRLLEAALAHLRKSSTRQSSAAHLRARLREISLNLNAASAHAIGWPQPGRSA